VRKETQVALTNNKKGGEAPRKKASPVQEGCVYKKHIMGGEGMTHRRGCRIERSREKKRLAILRFEKKCRQVQKGRRCERKQTIRKRAARKSVRRRDKEGGRGKVGGQKVRPQPGPDLAKKEDRTREAIERS